MQNNFFDYRTQPVYGDDVVDLHKTGMSFYDDFLSHDKSTIDYLKNKKNLVGQVIQMSPEEYFKACSDYGFPDTHPSVETLKQQRRVDTKTLNHLKDVILIAKRKFPMPVLNKAEHGQEGLHRMMVIGDMFGWDHKVPVLVVDWADSHRAAEQKRKERNNRIQSNIKKAVQEALRYKFTNLEELQEQIQWELDKQFEYNNDNIEVPVVFEFYEDSRSNNFVVEVGEASYSFDYDDVEFVSASTDSEEDDFDDETIEDFLVRYFGDDWREKHPDLKQTFNIK